MKTKPDAFRNTSKVQYSVTINGQEFKTWAMDEHAAISNVSYRYSKDNDEEVGLVMWKIKNDQYSCEVTKL
jgi:hypothetical protein